MASLLYTTAHSVDAIANAFNCDRRKALADTDLPTLRLVLSLAYAGVREPNHRSICDATSVLLTHALRGKITRHHPEEAAAAVALGFAEFHGVEFSLRPYNLNFAMLASVRDKRLGAEEVSHWLKGRVVSGDPAAPLTPRHHDLPLGGLVVAVSHPVTDARDQGTARDDYLVTRLTTTLTLAGAKVLTPTRRSSALGDPWRTNAQLRSDTRRRFETASVLIVLGDDSSGGVGAEVRDAIQLGLTTLLVKSNQRRSPWFDDPSVIVLPYGQQISNVPSILQRWLIDNRWTWTNSARISEDREVTTLPRRTMLAAAWNRLPAPKQEALARTIRLNRERAETILGSAIGFALSGHDELELLHRALDIPLPGPIAYAIEYDTSELEALALVSHERGIGVQESFRAATDLLIELTSVGAHRQRLDLYSWRTYFDTIGRGFGE